MNTLDNDAVSALVRHGVEDHVVMWNTWLFNRLQRLHGSGGEPTNALLSALRAYMNAVSTGCQGGCAEPYAEEVLRSLTPNLMSEGMHVLKVLNAIVDSTTSIIKPSAQQYTDDEAQIKALAARIAALASDAIARVIDDIGNHEKAVEPLSKALGITTLAILNTASREGILTKDLGMPLIDVVMDLAEPTVRALALLSLKFGMSILKDPQKLINRIINSAHSQGWNELFLTTMLNDPDVVEEFINGSTDWQEDLGLVIR